MKKHLQLVVTTVVVFTAFTFQHVKAQDKITAPASWLTAGNTLSANAKLGTLNNYPLQMYTNGKERMRISTSGKVAIGTIIPDSLLTVNGTASFANNVKFGTEDITKPNVSLRFGPYTSMLFDRNQYILRFTNSAEGMYASHQNSRIEFRDTGGIPNMWVGVNPRGNVYIKDSLGIGTETPAKKLQVQEGDIRISASTAADRYLEFVNTASNKIDYRFDHDAITGNGRLYISSSANDFTSFADRAVFDTAVTTGYIFQVFGKALATNWVNSDLKLKTNIYAFTNALEVIKQLQPKTYLYKQSEYKNLNLPAEKQYGFIAQEIEKVLPELVTTAKEPVKINTNGQRQMEDIKAINYTELIPILTKAIQEQQQEIEELKQELNNLSSAKNISSENSSTASNNSAISTASLQQNIPNPFNHTTTINYTLPQTYTSAKIIIVDKTGKVLKEINVSGNREGSIKLDASTLAAGAYNYSLYVKGYLMYTKQMILSK